MEWIFVTAVLVLCVYHRTFRRVTAVLAMVALLGLGSFVGYMLYTNHQQELARVSSPAVATGRDLSQELFGTPPVTLPDLPDRPPGTDQEARAAELARKAIARLRDEQARRDRIAALEARVTRSTRQESVEERWQRLMRESRQP